MPTLSLGTVASLLRAVDAVDAALGPRERLGLLADLASSAAAATALRAAGLFPERERRFAGDAAAAAAAVRAALRPAAAARAPPAEGALEIPGGCVRVERRAGTATARVGPDPTFARISTRWFGTTSAS